MNVGHSRSLHVEPGTQMCQEQRAIRKQNQGVPTQNRCVIISLIYHSGWADKLYLYNSHAYTLKMGFGVNIVSSLLFDFVKVFGEVQRPVPSTLLRM